MAYADREHRIAYSYVSSAQAEDTRATPPTRHMKVGVGGCLQTAATHAEHARAIVANTSTKSRIEKSIGEAPPGSQDTALSGEEPKHGSKHQP